jgi:hypothetical protein
MNVSPYMPSLSIMDLPAMVKIYVSLPGGKCLGKSSVSVVNFDSYGPFLLLFNDRCHLAT